jgi:predicted nucleic acid-binding protein
VAAPVSRVFLDTAFIFSLSNTRDEWHKRAVDWQARIVSEGRSLITTEFIVMEIGDGLAALRFRTQAARIVDTLRSNALIEIVPASSRIVDDAFRLFQGRDDKDWGMTDCSSFVVMGERGLSDALTMDRHFEQAGFRALLLDSE